MLTLRPNKKSVFQVNGLKILGMVGSHIFFNYFFSEKNTILPFKMHKIIFFPGNLKKILGFISKFR